MSAPARAARPRVRVGRVVETATANEAARTVYRLDLWATDDGVERCIYTTTGRGPVERLRAVRRLLDWADSHDVRVNTQGRGLAGSQVWEFAALMRRLRGQGVL